MWMNMELNISNKKKNKGLNENDTLAHNLWPYRIK